MPVHQTEFSDMWPDDITNDVIQIDQEYMKTNILSNILSNIQHYN